MVYLWLPLTRELLSVSETEGEKNIKFAVFFLSLRLFALQKSTSLSDGGIGLCNHSAPKLPIYIRREATRFLFFILSYLLLKKNHPTIVGWVNYALRIPN